MGFDAAPGGRRQPPGRSIHLSDSTSRVKYRSGDSRTELSRLTTAAGSEPPWDLQERPDRIANMKLLRFRDLLRTLLIGVMLLAVPMS